MNNGELDKLLKSMEVPNPPGADSMERAVQKARTAFSADPARGEGADPRDIKPHLVHDLLPSLCGALLLMLLWWMFDPSYRAGLGSAKVLAAATRELGEVLHVFPNELVAIVESKGRARLILEKASGPRLGQPLAVDITRYGRRTRILTFSGKKIELELSNEVLDLEFTVLPDGKVQVLSENFLWRSDGTGGADGYRIEAHTLDLHG